MEHFCDNNIRTNGKSLTQDKLYKIICTKLYESGVLDSIEFLEKNLSEYKKKCSSAWTEFIRDALDAKDTSFVKETNNNKISNINKLPARSFSVCDINSSSSESGYNSLEKKSKTKTNTIFLTVKEKNGEEPNGEIDKNYFRSVSNDPLRSSTNSQFSESNSRYINDFIEEQKLGHGGFGAVYRVRHTLDQLLYAVKKIQFRKTSSPTKLPQKILREVICLARLDHINVVRYYSAWLEYQIVPPSPSTITTTNKINKSSEFSNTSSNVICSISENDEDELEFDSPFVYQINLYIQMQLCSFSLKEWMERPDRRINYEENIAIFVQIARGLAYVHAEGLIHRDLKPSNIFVSVGYSQSENLSTAVIKLGDFGVATFIKDEAERAITQQAQQGSPDSLPGSANLLSTSFKNDDFELPSSSFASSPMAIKRTNPLAIQKKGSSPLLINTPVSYSLSQSYDQNKQSYRTTGIGTVAYASPEQLRKDTYDEKTDIYSLGIIFLELFYIFGTRMERAHILQDLRNNRKLPSEFQIKYPKEASMVLWLTAPDPPERPSAEELLKSDYLRDYQSVDDVCIFNILPL